MQKKIKFFAHLKKNYVSESSDQMCEVFFNEEPSKISEYFFSARIIMEKRVFLRAIHFRREFWARAFSNLRDKKASKTVIFEIENSDEKIKTMIQFIRSFLTPKFAKWAEKSQPYL